MRLILLMPCYIVETTASKVLSKDIKITTPNGVVIFMESWGI